MGYFGNVAAMIVSAIFGLLLTAALLRVVLPLSGARFRNPICQLIYKATNPIVAPIGKVIPNIRGVSTAGIVVALVICLVFVTILIPLMGGSLSIGLVLLLACGTLMHFVLMFYFWTIIIFALMSFFSPEYGNPAVELLHDLTTPVLRPFRNMPPKIQGLSLAPLWATLLIKIIDFTLTYLGIPGLLL